MINEPKINYATGKKMDKIGEVYLCLAVHTVRQIFVVDLL